MPRSELGRPDGVPVEPLQACAIALVDPDPGVEREAVEEGRAARMLERVGGRGRPRTRERPATPRPTARQATPRAPPPGRSRVEAIVAEFAAHDAQNGTPLRSLEQFRRALATGLDALWPHGLQAA